MADELSDIYADGRLGEIKTSLAVCMYSKHVIMCAFVHVCTALHVCVCMCDIRIVSRT